MGARRLLRPPAVRTPSPPATTAAVADQGDDGERVRARPEFLTVQARAVLAIWLGVTLVLVATYAIVLLVL
jgi:hypothetical protein